MLFRNVKKDNRDKGGNVRLPLLPLRDIIVFPHMVVPLFVGRQRSIKALEEAVASDKLIFLSTQRPRAPDLRSSLSPDPQRAQKCACASIPKAI